MEGDTSSDQATSGDLHAVTLLKVEVSRLIRQACCCAQLPSTDALGARNVRRVIMKILLRKIAPELG